MSRATVIVPTVAGGPRLTRLLSSLDPRPRGGRDPGRRQRLRGPGHRWSWLPLRGRGGDPAGAKRGLLRGGEPRGSRGNRGRARAPQRRLRLRTGIRRGDRGATRSVGRRDDGGGGDARGSPAVPDRHRGDAARPGPARLRLSEWRAGGLSGPGRPGPDRALWRRGGLRPRGVPGCGGLRRDAVRVLGGRRPGAEDAGPRGPLLARCLARVEPTTTRPPSGPARRGRTT